MRITKLHLLILFLLGGLGTCGYYFWQIHQEELQKQFQSTRAPAPTPVPETPPPVEAPPMPVPTVPEVSVSTVSNEASTEVVTYEVRAGDTLWEIAMMKQHFRAGHRWYDIWKANEEKIADFDRILAGQTLTIPLDKPDGYAWPMTSESRKNRILKSSLSKNLN